MIPKEAEIVVIGGGVIGSSAAYFLAKAGKDVVLIDKGCQAGEASGGNACFVWTMTRRAGIDVRLVMHSVEIHKQLQQELDMNVEYRRLGGLIVIGDEREIPFVEAHVKARAEDGYPQEMLDAKEAREHQPLLTEKILGAVYSPIDGVINPIFLVIALARQAKKLGAKVLYHTEARGIEVQNSKVKGVITDKGTIKTGIVVNAAGAWARFIGEMVGLEIPITPYQMQMVVTEQLPPVLNGPMMDASYMVQEYEKEELAEGDEEEFGYSLVASQQAAGNLILGATWRDSGYDKRTTREEIEAIARVNVKFLPSLRDVRVIRSYANFFPFTADDLPIMGHVEGLEGFIMAAGHCGHGISWGPGSGKLIQELICEGKTSVPLDELNLSRFS